MNTLGGASLSPIRRVPEADLSWDRFKDEFLKPGVPVIISHSGERLLNAMHGRTHN